MNLRWLLRMKRWANHPPSWTTVKLVAGVIALCILLYLYEYLYGWPEFLTTQPVGRGRMPRF
ncbi:MAG: hypothetical protein COB84_10035 [Rhodobacteraceae bacterium]|nr:MAG: hypothetical protein COB84_10035 [Paracoccaceae bacterium]